MEMGANKNPAQIRKNARTNAAAKQKTWEARGKPGEFDFEAVMAAAVAKMEVTSWQNAIPRAERWLVIKDLQRHLRVHGRERREKRQLLADRALARKKAGVTSAMNRRFKAIANWHKHRSITPITTAECMAKLKKDHGGSFGNYASAL